MLVGLYNWIGDSIPDSETIQKLQFTAAAVKPPIISPATMQNIASQTKNDVEQRVAALLSKVVTSTRIETCCGLDWRCGRWIARDSVFTYLGCDESFQHSLSPYFDVSVTAYSLAHNISFDGMLVRRFIQLEEEKETGVTGDGTECP